MKQKKKKEPISMDQDFETKKKAVLERKLKLSIKQKRGESPPKVKDVLPKKFFDPGW